MKIQPDSAPRSARTHRVRSPILRREFMFVSDVVSGSRVNGHGTRKIQQPVCRDYSIGKRAGKRPRRRDDMTKAAANACRGLRSKSISPDYSALGSASDAAAVATGSSTGAVPASVFLVFWFRDFADPRP